LKLIHIQGETMPTKKQIKKTETLVPVEIIQNKIYLIRGHKVMLDRDLAELYEVETKQLTRQVRRNIERFPTDFLIQLTDKERENLRCQFGTSSWGGLRYKPLAFTEQGVAMLSSVLNSKRAIQVNIAIMRAFVTLRDMIKTNKQLAIKMAKIEERLDKHDNDIRLVFDAIRQLMAIPDQAGPYKRTKIGFIVDKEGAK